MAFRAKSFLISAMVAECTCKGENEEEKRREMS
jgi:hypothetical protein